MGTISQEIKTNIAKLAREIDDLKRQMKDHLFDAPGQREISANLRMLTERRNLLEQNLQAEIVGAGRS